MTEAFKRNRNYNQAFILSFVPPYVLDKLELFCFTTLIPLLAQCLFGLKAKSDSSAS